MTSHMRIEGLNSAQEFIEKHPLYNSWKIKDWSWNRKCSNKEVA